MRPHALEHPREHAAREQHRREQVDAIEGVPLRGIALHEGTNRGRARVVHEDVDDRLACAHRRDRVRVHQVEHHPGRVRKRRRDACRAVLVDIGDEHPGAHRAEVAADRAPDPSGAAGDERHLPVERETCKHERQRTRDDPGREPKTIGSRMAGAASEEVLYRVEESGVAWLTLNRPEAGNSLTREQRSHILAHLEDAGADLGVRAIVLTASGDRHFCTGGDLRAAAAAEQRTYPGAPDRPIGTVMKGLESSLGAQRLLTALQDCPKPIIAAVNGTAAGLGAHVAFACDLVIAADTARFIEIFVRRGLIPDGGGPYLVTQLVGPQKAKELFFFGDDVPADEACRIGLINRVVPAAELEARTA